MLIFLLAVSLLFSPAQEKYLSREGAGTRLGEHFSPPEGAHKQQLPEGGFAYVWTDSEGAYNVKTTPDGYVNVIEWYLPEMPMPNTIQFRASIKSKYSQWLVEAKGNDSDFSDLYEDDYTRWQIAFGNLAELKQVLQLRMWDLTAQSEKAEESSAGGVNLDALFKMYGDEFPSGLGGIDIGNDLVPGEVWKPVSAESGKKFQYLYPDGNVFMITTDDQMAITSSAYTFKSQPFEFRKVIKDYLVSKYGSHLTNNIENNSILKLQFRQAGPEGLTRCLDLTHLEGEFRIEACSIETESEEVKQEPAAESDSYRSRLVLEELLKAEEGWLPQGLGPIKLGDVLQPGKRWVLSKTEGGLKHYTNHNYDNDDYTDVWVDGEGVMRNIQHNFLRPSEEFKQKVKSYLLGRFGAWLDSRQNIGGGSITYFLKRGSDGSETLSLAVYEYPMALSILVFYGEIER